MSGRTQFSGIILGCRFASWQRDRFAKRRTAAIFIPRLIYLGIPRILEVGNANRAKGTAACWWSPLTASCANLADTECALAAKAPVDSFGPSQTGDLPAQVTFEGRLPWNEGEAEPILDHGEPSGRKVQALAIGAAY